MCDYSLDHVASRPARVGETLISTRFPSFTRGFASAEDLDVAVCLRPGTELAFEGPVRSHSNSGFRFKRDHGHRVARFCQINMDRPNVHHDALEFPDGEIVLLTSLCEGQRATVLQLPADPHVETEKAPEAAPQAL